MGNNPSSQDDPLHEQQDIDMDFITSRMFGVTLAEAGPIQVVPPPVRHKLLLNCYYMYKTSTDNPTGRRRRAGTVTPQSRAFADSFGVHHYGLQVHGVELMFGKCIIKHDPREAGLGFVFKDSEPLGETTMALDACLHVAQKLGQGRFAEGCYERYWNNCLHFCAAWSTAIGGQEPGWWRFRGMTMGGVFNLCSLPKFEQHQEAHEIIFERDTAADQVFFWSDTEVELPPSFRESLSGCDDEGSFTPWPEGRRNSPLKIIMLVTAANAEALVKTLVSVTEAANRTARMFGMLASIGGKVKLEPLDWQRIWVYLHREDHENASYRTVEVARDRIVQELLHNAYGDGNRCCPGLVGKSMSAVVPQEEDCETGLQKEDPGCSPADTGAFSGVLPVDDSAAHPIFGDQIASADHGSDYSVVADAPDLERKEGDPLVDLALPQDGSNPAPPQDGQQPPLEKDQPDPSQEDRKSSVESPRYAHEVGRSPGHISLRNIILKLEELYGKKQVCVSTQQLADALGTTMDVRAFRRAMSTLRQDDEFLCMLAVGPNANTVARTPQKAVEFSSPCGFKSPAAKRAKSVS